MNRAIRLAWVAMGSAAFAGSAWGYSFQSADGNITGNFDSTVTLGMGIRAGSAGCGTVVGTDTLGFTPGLGVPVGASPGCLDTLSGYNDQGNLSYGKGQPFTEYVKGTHELLVHFPDDYEFMARFNWVRDFAAPDVSGAVSGYGGSALTPDARSDLTYMSRLLDFWASKTFSVGDETARVRVGNQVINWGESLFLPGGINQTNSVDLMRLSQPGTQLKEAMLPAPMVSVASGLGHGVNVEGYVQDGWNGNYFPPVGSYWSTSTIGTGAGQFANGAPGVAMPTANTPRGGGQYGLALRYQPDGTPVSLGAYTMRYDDKSPVAILVAGAPQYSYLEGHQLYGVSADFPLGDWAIGGELSYRPKDAIPLNSSAVGFTCPDNKCYVEEAKYQLDMTAMLQLSPGDQGSVLHLLGADSALLLAELAVVDYPHLQQNYTTAAGSWPIASGAWGWGSMTAMDSYLSAFPNGTAPATGTKASWGYNVDFSWTYDGSVIPGWQMTPEMYYFQAVKGYTPNAGALFMQGAKSANFVLTFTQNPANWSVGLNYARFLGPNAFVQPLLGRDFYGVYVSRNF